MACIFLKKYTLALALIKKQTWYQSILNTLYVTKIDNYPQTKNCINNKVYQWKMLRYVSDIWHWINLLNMENQFAMNEHDFAQLLSTLVMVRHFIFILSIFLPCMRTSVRQNSCYIGMLFLKWYYGRGGESNIFCKLPKKHN